MLAKATQLQKPLSNFLNLCIFVVLVCLISLSLYVPPTTNFKSHLRFSNRLQLNLTFIDEFQLNSTSSDMIQLNSTSISDLQANSTSTDIHDHNPPIILFWTKVFGVSPNSANFWGFKNPCPYSCIYTTNRTFFKNASAVVFHAHNINETQRLKPSNEHQKFVFFSLEAPTALERISRSRWWRDVLHFHWIVSYTRGAHIHMPYRGYILNSASDFEDKIPAVANFTEEEVFKDKKVKGALWFVSNCASQERMRVARALKKYFRVDIHGLCSTNKTEICPRRKNCSSIISQYYFYLAFENANCVDYATEKILDKLELPVIPVVMKRSVYADVLPPEAFVAVDDFPNAQKLAKYLTYLVGNPDKYFKLFKWRKKWRRPARNCGNQLSGFCALCKKVREDLNKTATPIPDLKQWFEENSKCSRAVSSSWYT